MIIFRIKFELFVLKIGENKNSTTTRFLYLIHRRQHTVPLTGLSIIPFLYESHTLPTAQAMNILYLLPYLFAHRRPALSRIVTDHESETVCVHSLIDWDLRERMLESRRISIQVIGVSLLEMCLLSFSFLYKFHVLRII